MKKNSVLCAIDVNDYDQRVIDLAATYAKLFGTSLELIHVTLSPDPGKVKWPAFVGSPNELIRENRLFKEIETGVKGVEIGRHHLSGFPVEKIVEFTQRNEPRLLVLGTHARKGVSRILGSIAAQIMRRVTCPVMVYRQTQTSRTQDLMQPVTGA